MKIILMHKLNNHELKKLLDEKADWYNRPKFIAEDPISIPHQFSKKQDIEISGLFAATLAWGIRKTIIKNCNALVAAMDNAPHDFIINHQPVDLKKLLFFKHRTFNTTDLLYFIHFLRHHYSTNDSLETSFSQFIKSTDENVEPALRGFYDYFFSLHEAPVRTKKHVPTPARKSACKRINMYLRWMVRQDDNGVDFGIWNQIKPSQLIVPLDLHVHRVALQLKLMERKQADWFAALELTKKLKKFDADDPAKYDFALFGMGVMEKYG